jgi:hypothetical protein
MIRFQATARITIIDCESTNEAIAAGVYYEKICTYFTYSYMGHATGEK